MKIQEKHVANTLSVLLLSLGLYIPVSSLVVAVADNFQELSGHHVSSFYQSKQTLKKLHKRLEKRLPGQGAMVGLYSGCRISVDAESGKFQVQLTAVQFVSV